MADPAHVLLTFGSTDCSAIAALFRFSWNSSAGVKREQRGSAVSGAV